MALILMRNLFYILFLTFTALFIYFRIGSILYKTVGYTYDQGRDFIAGSNIILLKKLPFIGPTTGINGLFHGSWWYYLLVIPYCLFGGAPIGYYWFNFFYFFYICFKANNFRNL